MIINQTENWEAGKQARKTSKNGMAIFIDDKRKMRVTKSGCGWWNMRREQRCHLQMPEKQKTCEQHHTWQNMIWMYWLVRGHDKEPRMLWWQNVDTPWRLDIGRGVQVECRSCMWNICCDSCVTCLIVNGSKQGVQARGRQPPWLRTVERFPSQALPSNGQGVESQPAARQTSPSKKLHRCEECSFWTDGCISIWEQW